MRIYGRKLKVFHQNGDLRSFLAKQGNQLAKSIDQENEDYILNVNEEEYINYKEEEFYIEPLFIDTEQAYADHKEEMTPAHQFPGTFNVQVGKSYPRMVIYFHIPVRGTTDLLYYAPSKRILWTQEMTLKENELVFKVIQFSDKVDQINREYESVSRNLKTMQEHVNKDIEAFNHSLREAAKHRLQKRKEKLLKRRNVLSGLNVPVRKSDNVARTFAVPTPKIRQKIIVKPTVTEQGYTPEPTLNIDVYREILQLIHGMGKEFERKPSVYQGKGEEQLRDHFLMMLEPNFEGSATGETFNKKGKTDILLRHEGSNVFIAECKFWKGKVSYLETIDQLLNYLTWRDSKAAVIMFVQNKDLSNVIEVVKNETPTHSHYLGFVDKEDETWFNYRFHIKGDRNREIKLAVMLYHIPQVN